MTHSWIISGAPNQGRTMLYFFSNIDDCISSNNIFPPLFWLFACLLVLPLKCILAPTAASLTSTAARGRCCDPAVLRPARLMYTKPSRRFFPMESVVEAAAGYIVDAMLPFLRKLPMMSSSMCDWCWTHWPTEVPKGRKNQLQLVARHGSVRPNREQGTHTPPRYSTSKEDGDARHHNFHLGDDRVQHRRVPRRLLLDDVLLVPQQQAPPQSSGADARTDINGHQMHDIANVDTKIWPPRSNVR